jgi:RNA polymerase sigma-70 factor (ECF subfamily)
MDTDHERFTRAWIQAQPALAAYLSSLIRDPHAVDEALQNVAVALVRTFADYDPARPFVAWAMGMAKIEVLRLRRQNARAPVALPPDLIDLMAETFAEIDEELEPRRHALRECLRGVQGRASDLVRLRYSDDLDPETIAARVGLTAGNVRIILHRVRATLLTCVERRLAVARRLL